MYINFDFFHLDFFMVTVILELSGGIKIDVLEHSKSDKGWKATYVISQLLDF